jgi:hypothetical protein
LANDQTAVPPRIHVAHSNNDRMHLSLEKDSPNSRAVEADGVIVSQPILGGLHHRYARSPIK